MNDKLALKEMAAQIVSRLTAAAQTPAEQTDLARKLFDEIAGSLRQDTPAPVHITAPNAVIEVADDETGRLYRRYLELSYDETGNGLRLLGDDIGGNPVQIVFLSNTALEKIQDLQGRGPDGPVCDH